MSGVRAEAHEQEQMRTNDMNTEAHMNHTVEGRTQSATRSSGSVVTSAVALQAEKRVLNSCHRCGATAYKTLIARDDMGAMRASGRYQCVQCKQEFTSVRQWRDGVQ